MSITAKKSEMQISCSKDPMTNSIRSSLLMEDRECVGHVQISGTKGPLADCLLNPPKNNAGAGHIVYVRRKPEADLAKTNICDAQSNVVDCPLLRKSTLPGETVQQLKEINEPVNCASEIAPCLSASSPSFCSTRHSASPYLERFSNISSPENIERVNVNCANPSTENPITVNVTPWKERYFQLQNLLKTLDQSEQFEYVEMLRTLSSIELNKHAVELEQRSIKLSLDEAREMQRVFFFDMLGNHGKNVSSSTTTQQEPLQ